MTSLVLLDGGLSTALEAQGATLNTSLWSGELLRTNRSAIRSAHQAFVEAGAKIVITSSYQITYPGCAARGWSDDETTAALQSSTELARFAEVKVAASVGPYGAYLADGSEYRGNYGLSIEELKEFHRDRLRILIDSHPDYLACETIPEITEARAIIELLAEFGSTIPFWISFSCTSATEISSGETFAAAVAAIAAAPHLIGAGINCTSPDLISALLHSAQGKSAFIVYPNSGREWDAINKRWLGDQQTVFAKGQIEQWKSLGAEIIGGCCGVAPSDIAVLGEML
jgi:homocysteine S-methyltransferase